VPTAALDIEVATARSLRTAAAARHVGRQQSHQGTAGYLTVGSTIFATTPLARPGVSSNPPPQAETRARVMVSPSPLLVGTCPRPGPSSMTPMVISLFVPLTSTVTCPSVPAALMALSSTQLTARRQPLAAIRLLAGARGGIVGRRFDGIIEEAQWLSDMVEGVIGGAFDDMPGRVDVGDLVAQCVHVSWPPRNHEFRPQMGATRSSSQRWLGPVTTA